jgi:DNA-binding response OmpR family regulator
MPERGQQMAGEQGKPRVLVIENDRDLADLLEIVLRQDGYVAEAHTVDAENTGPFCALRPNLVIVDLPNKLPEEGSPLLDALRLDSICRGVPVLAMAGQDAVADAAYANYNVAATLTKPFDIEDLIAKIDEALGRPPLHANVQPAARPQGILAEAEAIVARYSRSAIFRWVRRLQTTEPWAGKRELRLPDLLDGVPVLVEAVVLALHYGDVDEVFEHHPEVTDRAVHHAWLRHNQGIDLRSLIREYSLLREELWRTLSDHVGHALEPEDALTLTTLINGVLDRILQVAVPTRGTPPVENGIG